MNGEIRALDLISMLLKDIDYQIEDNIKIDIAKINRFRDNLFLEDISFDLGLNDFEDISYDYPQNILIKTDEIIIKIDAAFSNRLSKNMCKFNHYTKIIELWKKK